MSPPLGGKLTAEPTRRARRRVFLSVLRPYALDAHAPSRITRPFRLCAFRSKPLRHRAFDRSRRTIAVGSCAPAPLWEVLPTLASLYPGKTISSCMKPADELVRDLQSGAAHIIITNRAPEIPGAFGFVLGSERLFVSAPLTHPLAKHTEGVRFSDMAPYSFLLYSRIGDWEEVARRSMPDTHFIVQEDRDNFDSLVRLSALPSFATDLSVKHYGKTPGAVLIPILEDEAVMTYRCYVMNRNKDAFLPFCEKFA